MDVCADWRGPGARALAAVKLGLCAVDMVDGCAVEGGGLWPVTVLGCKCSICTIVGIAFAIDLKEMRGICSFDVAGGR